jgi:hypothetical protein
MEESVNAKMMRPEDLEITVLIDESANGEKTRGGPPPLQSKSHPELFFCPKCLERIENDPGYGLAYGGMGAYWMCEQDACDWFYKIMEEEEG